MNEFTATLPNATISAAAPTVLFSPSIHGQGTAIVDQKGKGKIAEYGIEEFAAEGGRGFRFTKLEGGTDRESSAYDVFLAAADGLHDSCECKGFLRHGHCKHAEAARAIADRTAPACKKPAPKRMPSDPFLRALCSPPAKGPYVSRDPMADQDRF